MKSFLFASPLFLLVLFTNSVCQAACTNPNPYFEINHSSLIFDGVLYDFPSIGKSTWFYKIDNTNGKKAISHTSFKVNQCLEDSDFFGGGTYISKSLEGLNYNNYFVLGVDPSNPLKPYSIKYNREVLTHKTTQVFFVLNQNLQIGTSPVYIKTGNVFEADSICTPSISCEAVPVSLINFTVNLEQDYPKLNWTTASENNCKGFAIEHSMNGAFIEIGFVEGANNSENIISYSFIDSLNTWGFYRLRIDDFDASLTYSPVIFLPCEGYNSSLVLYPTFVEEMITVLNLKSIIHSIILYNSSGQEIPFVTESGEQEAGKNIMVRDLPAGFYFIRVNDAETLRFIKR